MACTWQSTYHSITSRQTAKDALSWGLGRATPSRTPTRSTAVGAANDATSYEEVLLNDMKLIFTALNITKNEYFKNFVVGASS